MADSAKNGKLDVDGNKVRRLGHLDPRHTAVFVCDLQEKFGPSIRHFDTIVTNTFRIVEAADLLNMPVVATEQYPKVRKLKMSHWPIRGWLARARI